MYHVAVVYSPSGIRLMSVADSPEARDREVVDYVSRQAKRQLAPWTRDRVLEQLDRGAFAEAVQTYFRAVGHEWDHEWLHLEVVPGASGRRRARRARRPGVRAPDLMVGVHEALD